MKLHGPREVTVPYSVLCTSCNAQKSLVTAMTTRRKQQQQMVQRAMLAEEDRRRAARKNFRMLTVPVCQQASCEPALFHTNADDHEDGRRKTS